MPREESAEGMNRDKVARAVGTFLAAIAVMFTVLGGFGLFVVYMTYYAPRGLGMNEQLLLSLAGGVFSIIWAMVWFEILSSVLAITDGVFGG